MADTFLNSRDAYMRSLGADIFEGPSQYGQNFRNNYMGFYQLPEKMTRSNLNTAQNTFDLQNLNQNWEDNLATNRSNAQTARARANWTNQNLGSEFDEESARRAAATSGSNLLTERNTTGIAQTQATRPFDVRTATATANASALTAENDLGQLPVTLDTRNNQNLYTNRDSSYSLAVQQDRQSLEDLKRQADFVSTQANIDDTTRQQELSRIDQQRRLIETRLAGNISAQTESLRQQQAIAEQQVATAKANLSVKLQPIFEETQTALAQIESIRAKAQQGRASNEELEKAKQLQVRLSDIDAQIARQPIEQQTAFSQAKTAAQQSAAAQARQSIIDEGLDYQAKNTAYSQSRAYRRSDIVENGNDATARYNTGIAEGQVARLPTINSTADAQARVGLLNANASVDNFYTDQALQSIQGATARVQALNDLEKANLASEYQKIQTQVPELAAMDNGSKFNTIFQMFDQNPNQYSNELKSYVYSQFGQALNQQLGSLMRANQQVGVLLNPNATTEEKRQAAGMVRYLTGVLDKSLLQTALNRGYLDGSKLDPNLISAINDDSDSPISQAMETVANTNQTGTTQDQSSRQTLTPDYVDPTDYTPVLQSIPSQYQPAFTGTLTENTVGNQFNSLVEFYNQMSANPNAYPVEVQSALNQRLQAVSDYIDRVQEDDRLYSNGG